MNKYLKAISCIMLSFMTFCLLSIPQFLLLGKEELAEVIQEVATETYTREEQITSRGAIDRTRTQYSKFIFYKMIINDSDELYFFSEDSAKQKKNYLVNNNNSVTVRIEEVECNDFRFLSSEKDINNIISKYEKVEEPEVEEEIIVSNNDETCFPTVSHRVSSTYGYRSKFKDFHTGIDLSGNYGDNIYAYKSGKVVKVQHSNVSYGNMVLIEHDDGMRTRYAHMSSISVSLNQYVNCGEIIGHVGSTGNSTGNHLHFEVIINGNAVNPYNYIF